MAHQLLQRKTEQAVRISLGDGSLEGNLTLPESASALVLFAHGSGSSRFNPRSRFIADTLCEAGLATLLIDLLTRREERVEMNAAQLRFDIPLAAARLIRATDWLLDNPVTRHFHVGYFGASTDAAAALVAAAGRSAISAIVSLGGRPDLAGTRPLTRRSSGIIDRWRELSACRRSQRGSVQTFRQRAEQRTASRPRRLAIVRRAARA